MIGQMIEIAAGENFGAVALGGLLGGLLQPVVAQLNPRSVNPAGAAYWQSPLLGLAAAGISVYVLANSKTDNAVQLLFFALLCGLAFPAVLTSAVDGMSKRTSQVTQEVTEIASAAKADAIEDTAKAAQQLRTVLSQNRPETVKPEGQGVIETVAQQAVANIALTTASSANDQRQVVEELQEVGTVAKNAGWDGTAQAAADQLKMLSGTMKDETAKAAAESAAARLSS